MNQVHEILLRKNLPHVATIKNRNGDLEELSDNGQIVINHVIKGMSELNKNGIVLLDIQVGNSYEGITKIKNIESSGLYLNDTWIIVPQNVDFLPEGDKIIPFKSDTWALGEFLVFQKTGKNIPKRFKKSQKLLDTFIGDDEILKKILVIDPEKREYTWNIIPEDQSCTIQ